MLGGCLGGFLGEAIKLLDDSRDPLSLISMTAAWFGAIGLVISVALIAAQSLYVRHDLEPLRLLTGALAGASSAMAAGAVSQALFLIDTSELWRVICWGVAGGLLGLAISFHMINVAIWRGALGGSIGGILGGAAFVLVNYAAWGGVAARIIGTGTIGFMIGGMLALAETLLQAAWLEIRFPDGALRSLNLGPTTISIGGDPRRSMVYVAGQPPVAARYRQVAMGYEREDPKSHVRTPLRLGAMERFGSVVVTLRGYPPRGSRPAGRS